MPKKSDQKVVEATGSAGVSKAVGTSMSIEQAMSQAAAEAQYEGETDPNVIHQRMMDARQRIKDEMAAASAAQAEGSEK